MLYCHAQFPYKGPSAESNCMEDDEGHGHIPFQLEFGRGFFPEPMWASAEKMRETVLKVEMWFRCADFILQAMPGRENTRPGKDLCGVNYRMGPWKRRPFSLPQPIHNSVNEKLSPWHDKIDYFTGKKIISQESFREIDYCFFQTWEGTTPRACPFQKRPLHWLAKQGLIIGWTSQNRTKYDIRSTNDRFFFWCDEITLSLFIHVIFYALTDYEGNKNSVKKPQKQASLQRICERMAHRNIVQGKEGQVKTPPISVIGWTGFLDRYIELYEKLHGRKFW